MNRLATLAILAFACTEAVVIRDHDGANYEKITGRNIDEESISSLEKSDIYSMVEQREQNKEVAAAFNEMLEDRRQAKLMRTQAQIEGQRQMEVQKEFERKMEEESQNWIDPDRKMDMHPRGTFEIKPQPVIETTSFA